MLKKRIIPCLDIKDGRTVKGINFVEIRDAGDPVELAIRYMEEGADELVFLDITATVENRKTLIDLVQRISKEINIPFTVGGGVKTVEDASVIIESGADKISLNSAAIKRPELITEIADRFGNQCVVVAIDVKRDTEGIWWVYIAGGRIKTDWKAMEWAREVQKRGAGELLVTSMNNDGTKQGFAEDLLSELMEKCSIPVIASGGAGSQEHFRSVFEVTDVGAALAASVFHYGEIPIPELKNYLQQANIPVRTV